MGTGAALGLETGEEAVAAGVATLVAVGATAVAGGDASLEAVGTAAGFDTITGAGGGGRQVTGRVAATGALGTEPESLGAWTAVLPDVFGAALAELAGISLAVGAAAEAAGPAESVVEAVGAGGAPWTSEDVADSSGVVALPKSLSRNTTPATAAAATTPRSTKMPDPPFFDGLGGGLEMLGRTDGRNAGLVSSSTDPLARGDSRVVRGGSDVDLFGGGAGAIPATIALAFAASGPEEGASEIGEFEACEDASIAVSLGTAADVPAKSGLVPTSSIEPPASRSASSSSSAACFMTVCSCFGSCSTSGLAFGNIATVIVGRGGDEWAPGGRVDAEEPAPG